MAATCARGDDFCLRRLIVDCVEQALGDLDGKVVFLCECAKCACHSATRSVEYGGFPARQAFRQSAHESRIHDRLCVAMRMNRNGCRTFDELKCIWFLREQIVNKFFEQETALRYVVCAFDI